MRELITKYFFILALLVGSSWTLTAHADRHRFREDPEESQPRVTRYACCEDIDIRDGPVQSGAVLGQLNREEQVYVFNLFGTGLPSGLAGCLGTGAPCGTLWAEIYAVDQRISGFVPLNSLFLRKAIPKEGRLQYEIGFQRIFDGLRQGLQSGLVAPAGCGDPSNVTLYRGSDMVGDWILTADRKARKSCNAVLNSPVSVKVSCDGIDRDAVQFAQCIYESDAECSSGVVPTRDPSDQLGFCIENNVSPRGACGTCRAWYELTGQDASGWQSAGELVDSCLAQINNFNECPLPSGTPTGSSGGDGGSDHAVGDGFAPDGGIPDGEFDPSDIPQAPEPLVTEPNAPDSIVGADGTQTAQSNCVTMCQETLQTWRSSSCRNYLGSADRKYLADRADYECGEIPVGRTHPLYFLNLDTGDMSGDPDPNWKWLRAIPLGKTSESLIVFMGRVGQQTSFLSQINDLTRNEEGRYINFASRLGQQHIWMRLAPATSDRLEIEVCVFVPGVRIDSNPIRPDPTSTLGTFVEEIDLGGVKIDRVELCQPYFLSVNNSYRFGIRPRRNGNLRIEIEPGSLEGVDITYTSVTNALTVAAPVVNVLLVGLRLEAAAAEHYSETGYAEFLLDALLFIYSEDIREDLVDTVQTSIDDGVDQLNGIVDIPELLGTICGDLAPTVGPSNPTYWFNEFLRWQCEGFANEPNLRAFIPHTPSESQGCYQPDWFINPQDSAQNQWWTPYSGQSWAYNLIEAQDQGCRVAGQISTALDRDTWPTLVCAMAMHNVWLNGPNFPQGGALRQAIQNNCGGFVNQALGSYYGDGQDLIELYTEANRPNNPAGGVSGFTTE